MSANDGTNSERIVWYLKRRHIRVAALAAITVLAIASAPSRGAEPTVSRAVSFESSVPVRLLPPAKEKANVTEHPPINPLANEPDRGERGTWTRGRAPLDPLITRSQNSGRTPALDLVFDGTGNPFAFRGAAPPDTVGAVGKDHYIQIVNKTKVAIFNKDGSPARDPFDLGSLWSSGACKANNGDAVVVYDQFADRWVMTQLPRFGFARHLCLAISQTGDPLGAYYLYAFETAEYPDYFKLGVWPNAYYGSAF